MVASDIAVIYFGVMTAELLEASLGHATRTRVMAAAIALIDEGGVDAATTRAVAAMAGVQAPTIYRLFGDKDGLLRTAAENAFADYVARKSVAAPRPDPVQALTDGWDTHVAFGFAHPAVFRLIWVGGDRSPSSAACGGMVVLRQRVRRVAEAGRLRVTEERAVDLLHATATGVILTSEDLSDAHKASLSQSARESVFAAILDLDAPAPPATPGAAASALRARIDYLPGLTPGEKLLLDEILQRIAKV